jgi:hypothetical protein
MTAAALLQRLHHWAGNRVGDAEPAAKVFKGVPVAIILSRALTIASMSVHSAMTQKVCSPVLMSA